jgi:hypothetical protein
VMNDFEQVTVGIGYQSAFPAGRWTYNEMKTAHRDLVIL